jgi:hypothetical protein
MATATQNHQEAAGSYGGSSFKPFSLDVDTIEPDAYPGQYEGRVDRCKAQMSSTGKPMLIVEWKITSTSDESEDCQKSVGGSVADFIVFAAGRDGNPAKVKLRTLRDRMGLDPDVIPTTISSLDDLKELGQALKGQTLEIWVANKTDGDGNVRTNVHYTAPRTAAGMSTMNNGDEEEEAPPARKAATKPTGKKPAARR